MLTSRRSANRGFTLLEILLIVAALSIISGMTLVAINPARQFADSRNAERQMAVGTIWSALHQYALDTEGELPENIPEGTLADCLDDPVGSFTICKTEACPLTLSELLEEERYLSEIPADPSVEDDDLSGYNVVSDTEHHGRVLVCAPAAENGESILSSAVMRQSSRPSEEGLGPVVRTREFI